MKEMYNKGDIESRLQYENPWWKSKKIDEFFDSMKVRLYYDQLFKILNKKVRRALVLLGPRRVGKTVMLHHLIRGLIDEQGIDPLKIAFISIDAPIYTDLSLEALFKFCRDVTKKSDLRGWYVFFDEIQYLKNWENHLKSLVDTYPECRFIVSGSAAATLRKKSNESGAGRFTNFLLPPLAFEEFLYIKNLNFLPEENNFKTLNRQFCEYVNFGGYPEIVLSLDAMSDTKRYVKDDIVDKVLLRDLPMLFGIKDVNVLRNFFNVVAYQMSKEFSLDSLEKDSQIDKITITKYLDYLEASFLVKKIKKISDTAKRFKRLTHFKVYLTNTSLRSALFSPVFPDEYYGMEGVIENCDNSTFGRMVENAIFTQLFNDHIKDELYYARWDVGEVDLVVLNSKLKPCIAIEIKWSNGVFLDPYNHELKSLLSFMRKNKIKEAIVTTIDKEGEKEINGLKIIFIPAALLALRIGNILPILKKELV